METMNMNAFSLHLTTIIVLFSLLHLNLVSPVSFHFDNFKGKAVREENYPRGLNLVSLQKDASVDNLGVIDLTAIPGIAWPKYSAGRAVYSEPMQLWDNKTGEMANFTTEFSFIIDILDRNRTTCGDGFTFFLSHYPSIILPGAYGVALGLTAGVNKFNAGSETYVAVEFDTLSNGDWEPNSFHMGIDINSIKSAVDVNLSSKFIDGVGYKGKAKVSYNANTYTLSAFLLDDEYKKSYGAPILSHVVDLRDVLPQIVSFGFSASTSHLYELHRIKSWSFTSTLDYILDEKNTNHSPNATTTTNENKGEVATKNSKIWFYAGIVFASCMGVFLSLDIVLWYIFAHLKKRYKTKEEENEFEDRIGPQMYSYMDLKRGTGNFAEERKLGEGGFGVVYKGILNVGGSSLQVAIKRISKQSDQGEKEYLSEVNIISRLSHRNLVKLLGWCHQKKEFLVVYEFLPPGSLDLHLFNPKRFLSWSQRHKIVLGLASAVLYLHESCEKYVVHRDIKSSNVLLDESFETKLGDFGLARLVEHGDSMQTTIVAGTRGYIAPECVYTGKFSKESDVFAFGIVALEVVCGKRCIYLEEDNTPTLLIKKVAEMFEKQRHLEVVDERLSGHFDKEQVERDLGVGLWCAQPDIHKRPSMTQAIALLNFEDPMPDLPTHFPPISTNGIQRDMSSIASTSSSQLVI